MAGETEDEIPDSGAVFTFGKSKFADNAPSKFWLKNDVPLRISCGDEHTALVTENGKLFMFGSNNWGQLGLGTKTTVNKPTCVKALKSERVRLAACGRTHTLVYTSRGNVYACGGNNEGQLGLGDCEDRTSFHLLDFFSKHGAIKMLSAGSNTSAALTLDGALFTFGERDSGKLGLSTEKLANHKVPQEVTGISNDVVQVACGGGHTVALTENEVYSFGLGQFGQLGHGTFIFESRLPRVVEHFRRGRVKHVACGENHTALITDNGLLYTFGDGRHGKLGLGEENFTNQFKPTLCPRFLHYNVHSEEDVTEDYWEKSCSELLGHTQNQSTLNRSFSARVRRRERERSPDQFGPMFRTLPALGAHPNALKTISASLPVPSQIRHPRSSLNGKISHSTCPKSPKTSGKKEKSLEDGSSMEDSESVKDLGETTDLLNLTHIMKMDPSDDTLLLSPMEKKKVKVVKVNGKERGKPREGPSRQRQEYKAHKALPTELLQSSSDSSVFGDSHAAETPKKCPKRRGHDKENVLIALRGKEPADGSHVTMAESKSIWPKCIEMESRKTQDEVLLKGSLGSTLEGASKAKQDRLLQVKSQSQKDLGKVKKKTKTFVEQQAKQDMYKEVDSSGKISKNYLPKAKTENKSLVSKSTKSDSGKDINSSETSKEISTDSHPPSKKDIPTKKTKMSTGEQKKMFAKDIMKAKAKKEMAEDTSKSESAFESEGNQLKENPLTSFLQNTAMGTSALLLGETAVSQFLSKSPSQKIPEPLSKERTLSDVSSLGESFEVSGQGETKESKRTTVTINVKTEQDSSDVGTESKAETHSKMGTTKEIQGEESNEEQSEESVSKREISEGLGMESSESEDMEESDRKNLGNVGDEDSEVSENEEEVKSDDSKSDNEIRVKDSSEDGDNRDKDSEVDHETMAKESSEDGEDKSQGSETMMKGSSEDGNSEDNTEKGQRSEVDDETTLKGYSEGEEEEEKIEDSSFDSETSANSASGDEKSEEEEEKSNDSEVENSTVNSSNEDEEGEEEEKRNDSEVDDSNSSIQEEEEKSNDLDSDDSTVNSSNEDEEETSNDSEIDDEANVQNSSEDQQSEEEEDKSKSETTEDLDSEEGEEDESQLSADKSSEDEDESEEEEEEEEESEQESEEKSESGSGKSEEDDDEYNEVESDSEAMEDEDTNEEEEEEQESESEDESEAEEEEESIDEPEEDVESEEDDNESDEETDKSEEDEEEAEEEESDESEENEEAEDEEDVLEEQESSSEEEEEEEEEEKEKPKRKQEKASSRQQRDSSKTKSGMKTTKPKAKQFRAQSDQSDDESHESQQFWDDLRTDEMNGNGENEEYFYEDGEHEDEEEEECLGEGEEEMSKEEDLDEHKIEETEGSKESDVQNQQVMNEKSVALVKDPCAITKEEILSEKIGVTKEKPKSLFSSTNRLSLFKRTSTKGNQGESVSSGKPEPLAHQISPTGAPESSSSDAQTNQKTNNRSHSATCSVL
ncbi:hypothetical protein DNTS_034080 [Danionella cerebrum]|uniref:Uncharacterized protein n=1 Tax=Danionella cerebrum TaxID=2873325 RepID=A0A553QQP3_9TELE|nr:hypothetical protein DNTS_034080 [Danionella translucida]